MTARYAPRSPDRLGELLARVAKQAAQTYRLRVPELDVDPDDDDPVNLWLLADGRLRARTSAGTVHEYVPIADQRPGLPTFSSDPAASSGWRLWLDGATGRLKARLQSGTVQQFAPVTTATSTAGGTPVAGPVVSTVTKPPDPVPKSYRKIYVPTWARAFCSSHGVETGSTLYYGNLGSGAHGERRIMIGLDDAQIRADLGGSTIRAVELKVQNEHAWSYDGTTISWGGHNRHDAPDTFSAVQRDAWSSRWPRVGYGGGDDQYHEMSHGWFGRALRDNQIKGLTVDQPTGKTSYGALDWATLRLAIDYSK